MAFVSKPAALTLLKGFLELQLKPAATLLPQGFLIVLKYISC